jgi:hypothetical protein
MCNRHADLDGKANAGGFKTISALREEQLPDVSGAVVHWSFANDK